MPRLLWAATLFFLAACGTLEVGFESQTGVDELSGDLPSPPSSSAGAAAMPVENASPQPLNEGGTAALAVHVAFIKNGNVWLWTERRGAIPLTHDGSGITDVRLSDDGTSVAFLRQGALWVIDSEGRGERQLVSQASLNALAANGERRRISSFDWVPGQKRLAFNTRQLDGVDRSDDLHLVDTGSLALTTWLPTGEGGEFYYSDDGRLVAIVNPGIIRVLRSNDRRQQALLTYTPIQIADYMKQLTSSSWPSAESGYPPDSAFDQLRHYVRPEWAADSRSLWVAIPPTDPLARPVQSTTIWQIPLDGTAPRLKASLAAEPLSAVAFSPDKSQVAYVTPLQPAAGHTQVEIVALASGDFITSYDEAYALFGWSLDSKHLAFVRDPAVPRIGLATVDGGSLPVGWGSTPMSDLRWVDASQFLYLVPEAPDWDLCLGKRGDEAGRLLADRIDFPMYDFTVH